jgi:DNA-binding HxlR family transcriptional regulator
LISRRVITDSPVAVEYEMTALGRSLQAPFKALYGWSVDHMDQVEAARATFDARLAACAVAV